MKGQSVQYMFRTARVMVRSAAKAEDEASKPNPSTLAVSNLVTGFLHS
jgi:hypothetical protein